MSLRRGNCDKRFGYGVTEGATWISSTTMTSESVKENSQSNEPTFKDTTKLSMVSNPFANHSLY